MDRGLDTDTSRDEQEILLWHPQVHYFFGESLYFFALRFRSYSRDMLEHVRTSLVEHGIVGICLYEVVGEYDVLLSGRMELIDTKVR